MSEKEILIKIEDWSLRRKEEFLNGENIGERERKAMTSRESRKVVLKQKG